MLVVFFDRFFRRGWARCGSLILMGVSYGVCSGKLLAVGVLALVCLVE